MIVLGIIVCLVILILISGKSCEPELKANQSIVDYLRSLERNEKKEIPKKCIAGKSITYPASKEEK